ncbi:hypothetical protein [Clostridium septicum]|uniref:hypothetical protein n=1 Tax=Clostridium septicum TaxID=1504 RepID=UPI00159EE7D4|nr:hypothetical protein [Clostridium septicum]
MTIRELREALEKYDGEVEINFGFVDGCGDGYCSCEVEIEMDSVYEELNITVL